MIDESLRVIRPAELDEFWPAAAPLLELGLRHGTGYRWTLDALRESIADSRRHLWLTWPSQACAVITQFEDYPAAKLMRVFWLCGSLPENWVALLHALERWAASCGYTEVESGGRPGMRRLMAKAGYAPAPWVTMTKDIRNA